MTYMIKELVDTRYLYVSIGKDLEHLLDTCKQLRSNPEFNYFSGNALQEKLFQDVKAGDDPVFDFADTKITTDVANLSVLRFVTSEFKVIDSKDAKRDSVFKESQRRLACTYENVTIFPDWQVRQSPKDYIKNLRLDCTYVLPTSTTQQIKALVIMATILRPKLKFVINNVQREIFDYIAPFLTPEVLEKYDEFYYSTPEGIEVLKLVDGLLDTQRLGKVPILEAASAGHLVPTAFGTERLYEDPAWRPIFDSCYGVLQQCERERKKNLFEVINGGPLSSIGG